MSVARFALRKIRSRESVEALKHLVNTSSDPGTLSNAAFALWRTGDKDLLRSADRRSMLLQSLKIRKSECGVSMLSQGLQISNS